MDSIFSCLRSKRPIIIWIQKGWVSCSKLCRKSVAGPKTQARSDDYMFCSLDPMPPPQCCRRQLTLANAEREGARKSKIKNSGKEIAEKMLHTTPKKLTHGNSSSTPRPSLWRQIYLLCNISEGKRPSYFKNRFEPINQGKFAVL